MATNPDLPEDILLEIFSRLPTKSVGKCRCLSKSWRRDLSTTDFIKKHLITRQQTIHHQNNLALITDTGSLHIVTSPLKIDEQVKELTGVLEKCHTLLLGECNGLVLLGVNGKFLMVINPITLQQVNISDSIRHLNFYLRVYGFGYDCCTDDFKIISLYPANTYNEEGDSHTLVDVYSVKRGVWNRLDTSVCPYGGEFIPSPSQTNGVFVNGVVHWFIRRISALDFHIAAFDLAEEVFHQIPIPAEFDRELSDGLVSMREIGIAVIGGCLSIVHNSSSGGSSDVWMMMEYGVAESWVRFHVGDHGWDSIRPLCLVGDEKLMCYTQECTLVVCDLKDGTTKEVIVGGEDSGHLFGISFADSLIFPGKCQHGNDSG